MVGPEFLFQRRSVLACVDLIDPERDERGWGGRHGRRHRRRKGSEGTLCRLGCVCVSGSEMPEPKRVQDKATFLSFITICTKRRTSSPGARNRFLQNEGVLWWSVGGGVVV